MSFPVTFLILSICVIPSDFITTLNMRLSQRLFLLLSIFVIPSDFFLLLSISVFSSDFFLLLSICVFPRDFFTTLNIRLSQRLSYYSQYSSFPVTSLLLSICIFPSAFFITSIHTISNFCKQMSIEYVPPLTNVQI